MKSDPDVIVIGGGVIGCAVAFELARRSARVTLIDKSLPGRATSASAGGLWPVGEAVGLGCGVIFHAQRQDSAEGGHASIGPEALPDVFRDFLIESNRRFPTLADDLIKLGGVDIEFDRGAGLMYVIYNESELAFVEHLLRGMPEGVAVERLSSDQATRVLPCLTRELLGAVLFPGEHQVNPMLLAEGFKRAAIRLGADFRAGVRVTGIRTKGDRVLGVEINGDLIPCRTVVNAAGAWASKLAATAGLELPVVPIRGQIVLTEPLPRCLPLCLSTSSTYLTQKAHGEILIGSTTEDVGFDVGVTSDAIRKLCRGAIRSMPMLKDVLVKRVWAGLRPGTPDELPILGGVEGLVGYVNATGGFRTGIVAAPLTGEVIAQLVCGEEPSFQLDPFLANRLLSQSGHRVAS